MKYVYIILVISLCIIGERLTQSAYGAGKFVPHVLEMPPPSSDLSAIAGRTVPKHCHGMPQHLVVYCNIAMNYQITIPEARNIDVAASAEMTANICGFKLTDNFEVVKNNLFISEQRRQAYLLLLSGTDSAKSSINNIRVWCKQAYNSLGPKSPLKWYK